MKTLYDQFNRPQRTPILADVPLSKFNDRLKTSRRYQVFAFGNGVYQVQLPDTGVKHIVDLQNVYATVRTFRTTNRHVAMQLLLVGLNALIHMSYLTRCMELKHIE